MCVGRTPVGSEGPAPARLRDDDPSGAVRSGPLCFVFSDQNPPTSGVSSEGSFGGVPAAGRGGNGTRTERNKGTSKEGPLGLHRPTTGTTTCVPPSPRPPRSHHTPSPRMNGYVHAGRLTSRMKTTVGVHPGHRHRSVDTTVGGKGINVQ